MLVKLGFALIVIVLVYAFLAPFVAVFVDGLNKLAMAFGA